MKKPFILVWILIIISIQFVCSQNALENNYDVKQYILDLQISNSSTVISGNVIINAKVSAPVIDTIVFELINTIVANITYMVVDSVFVNGVVNIFQHHNDLVFIPLVTSMPENQLFSVRIYYHGNGHAVSQSGYNGIATSTYSGNTHSYNLNESESYGSKMWFPSKQVLTDKPDSVTFYITTDSTNKTGSNGLLVSKTTLSNGKCKYKWVTHYPIAYYLISFVVGPYEENTHYTKLPGSQDSVLMQNLLIPGNVFYPIHLKAIGKADDLMNFYSGKFGIYPFKKEKYGNSVIGVQWSGMEHQTMCTMGLLVLDTTMTDLTSFGSPVYCWGNAHEFAHHWFGDYVTCANWNDIWLNEGIGSYVEYIAIQNLETQSRADLWMKKFMALIKTRPEGSVYIPDSLLNFIRIFDSRLTYCKGGAVMHMLRYEINNDSVFFAALRNYLSEHAYANVTTGDLKQSMESTANIDFTDFFDQWIYGEGYPDFAITWSQDSDTLTIQSNQTTSTSTTTLFKTHFDLKIKSSVGDTIVRLFQGSNNETYKIYLPVKVDSIEFDPQNWLIQNNSIHLGIEEKNNPFSFSIIPNPAKDKITIIVKQVNQAKNTFLSAYNIQGQLLFQQQIKNEKTELDISGFAKGVYLIKLSSYARTEVSRFVKE
jgi:aminopeptidase N